MMPISTNQRDLAFTIVTSSISGAGLSLVLLCLFHTLAARPHGERLREQSPGSR